MTSGVIAQIHNLASQMRIFGYKNQPAKCMDEEEKVNRPNKTCQQIAEGCSGGLAQRTPRASLERTDQDAGRHFAAQADVMVPDRNDHNAR